MMTLRKPANKDSESLPSMETKTFHASTWVCHLLGFIRVRECSIVHAYQRKHCVAMIGACPRSGSSQLTPCLAAGPPRASLSTA